MVPILAPLALRFHEGAPSHPLVDRKGSNSLAGEKPEISPFGRQAGRALRRLCLDKNRPCDDRRKGEETKRTSRNNARPDDSRARHVTAADRAPTPGQGRKSRDEDEPMWRASRNSKLRPVSTQERRGQSGSRGLSAPRPTGAENSGEQRGTCVMRSLAETCEI